MKSVGKIGGGRHSTRQMRKRAMMNRLGLTNKPYSRSRSHSRRSKSRRSMRRSMSRMPNFDYSGDFDMGRMVKVRDYERPPSPSAPFGGSKKCRW